MDLAIVVWALLDPITEVEAFRKILAKRSDEARDWPVLDEEDVKFVEDVPGAGPAPEAAPMPVDEGLAEGETAPPAPELEEGEFHLLDLIGLEARLSPEGPVVGTVSDLISGGNDLLELTTANGRKLMIPFVEAIVPDVHLEEGWLLLTPPPGLLEL